MHYRKLGRTDIEVSVIAMGCWAIVGDFTWGPQDEADALAAIDTALEVGINFFDTAEGYGNGASEEMLGRALRGRRDKAVIATKVSASHLRRDQVIEACEASLRRLETDHIDLYQIHWPDWDVPFDETIGALRQLQRQGKVRAIGVSNFGPRDLVDVLDVGRVETNQLPYSLLFRAIEYEIQPLCVEHEVGVLCYSPLAQGLLTGKFRTADEVPSTRARTRHFSTDRPHARHGEPGCERETFAALNRVRTICQRIEQPMARVALAWLLEQPAVTRVLAGARDPEQVRQNAAAADLKLDEALLRELDNATRPLRHALGPNPDPWEPAERCRLR